jgi:hypothetical protein
MGRSPEAQGLKRKVTYGRIASRPTPHLMKDGARRRGVASTGESTQAIIYKIAGQRLRVVRRDSDFGLDLPEIGIIDGQVG